MEKQEKEQQEKEQQREMDYTIKIIPSEGDTVHSIRLPGKMVRYGLISLCAGAVLFVGAFGYTAYSTLRAQSSAAEIQELRQVNSIQQEQLLQLSKKANELQDEMDQLTQMENELRRLSGAVSDQNAENPGGDGTHDGQGGPRVAPDVKNVREALDNIEKNIAKKKASLAELRETMKQQQVVAVQDMSARSSIPSIWPASGDVSSPYGMRWGGSDFHPGIDIANDYGTPIVAAADGIVTAAGWNSGGYGNMVDIDHGNGLMTRYGHAQQVVVSIGQSVRKGQIIAYMGSTGFSTGPHVHYEVHVNGQVVNPIGYL